MQTRLECSFAFICIVFNIATPHYRMWKLIFVHYSTQNTLFSSCLVAKSKMATGYNSNKKITYFDSTESSFYLVIFLLGTHLGSQKKTVFITIIQYNLWSKLIIASTMYWKKISSSLYHQSNSQQFLCKTSAAKQENIWERQNHL